MQYTAGMGGPDYLHVSSDLISPPLSGPIFHAIQKLFGADVMDELRAFRVDALVDIKL